MCSAYSSGGLGDIVYQIPAMRQLGVSHVFLAKPFYDPMKRLLSHAGFSASVGEPEDADYNMDHFRKQPMRGVNHIMTSIANQFGLPKPTFDPWLFVPIKAIAYYEVVHLTPRWREGSIVKWDKILSSLINPCFIGLPEEHDNFEKRYGHIGYHPTTDIYEMAQVIAGAYVLYCNQSSGLALAQAMGKDYYCEFKPGKTNCMTYQPNEHKL